MSEKTVLILPRHSPKSGIRNEKTFFLIFFWGMVKRPSSLDTCLDTLTYITTVQLELLYITVLTHSSK